LSVSLKIVDNKDKIGVRFAGSGGQGAVLVASILGEGAVLSGLYAAGSSSYGSRARGGAASSDVIISTSPIDYPHISHPDLLVAMSQESYDQNAKEVVSSGGLILYDDFFVKKVINSLSGVTQIPVPATQSVLEKLSSPRNANIFMLAIAGRRIKVVEFRVLLDVAISTVEKRFIDSVKIAFEMGWEFAEKCF